MWANQLTSKWGEAAAEVQPVPGVPLPVVYWLQGASLALLPAFICSVCNSLSRVSLWQRAAEQYMLLHQWGDGSVILSMLLHNPSNSRNQDHLAHCHIAQRSSVLVHANGVSSKFSVKWRKISEFYRKKKNLPNNWRHKDKLLIWTNLVILKCDWEVSSKVATISYPYL